MKLLTKMSKILTMTATIYPLSKSYDVNLKFQLTYPIGSAIIHQKHLIKT